MSLFGDRTEDQLREQHLLADRGTDGRAIVELLDALSDLRDLVGMFADRRMADGPCWCVVPRFDDGSPREWSHDERCRDAREAIGA